MLLLFFQRKNMFIYVKVKKLVVPARDFTTYLARDLSSMTQDNLPPLRSVDCRAAPLLTIPALFNLVATAPAIATNLKTVIKNTSTSTVQIIGTVLGH